MRTAIITLCITATSYALTVDVNNTASVQSAAAAIAKNVMSTYANSSTIVGLFPPPYYWWESGLAWDSMIMYWALTGDTTYNDIVGGGIMYQTGPNNDFMPPNQTKSEGNDDQTFWALAAMTAAERGFPLPSSQKNTSWVQLAQNVFDTQVARWDTSSCGGGLRWQIFSFNNGYNYKNSLTNGNFMQLAARLALFTGNSTYSDWAQKVATWSIDSGLISSSAQVWDGTDTSTNCSQFNHLQWTASAGTYLSGSAYALNKSATAYWNGLSFPLLTSINATFAPNGILTEVACAPSNNCNTDQRAFRTVLVRALANTRDLTWNSNITSGPANATNGTLVGSTHGEITKILQGSALGAAAQCSIEGAGTVCGFNWSATMWDGTQGLGQSLSALEVMLANLPPQALRNINSTGTVTAGGSNATLSTSNGTTAGSNGTTGIAISNDASDTTSRHLAALLGIGGLVSFVVLLL